MALSFTQETPLLANVRRVLVTLTFDASYVTGGEAILPSDVGLGEILHINFNQGEDGYTFHWDSVAQTVIAYQPDGTDAAQVEVDNATDLSNVVVEVEIVGR
jgi:hypothetical protein